MLFSVLPRLASVNFALLIDSLEGQVKLKTDQNSRILSYLKLFMNFKNVQLNTQFIAYLTVLVAGMFIFPLL